MSPPVLGHNPQDYRTLLGRFRLYSVEGYSVVTDKHTHHTITRNNISLISGFPTSTNVQNAERNELLTAVNSDNYFPAGLIVPPNTYWFCDLTTSDTFQIRPFVCLKCCSASHTRPTRAITHFKTCTGTCTATPPHIGPHSTVEALISANLIGTDLTCQRLVANNNSPWFLTIEPSERLDSTFVPISAALPEGCVDITDSIPNYLQEGLNMSTGRRNRDMSPFETHTGVRQFLESPIIEFLPSFILNDHARASTDPDSVAFHSCFMFLAHVLSTCGKFFDFSAESIRCLMGKVVGKTGPLRIFQEDRTKYTYSTVFAKFVLWLVSVDWDQLPSDFPLHRPPTDVREHLETLRDALVSRVVEEPRSYSFDPSTPFTADTIDSFAVVLKWVLSTRLNPYSPYGIMPHFACPMVCWITMMLRASPDSIDTVRSPDTWRNELARLSWCVLAFLYMLMAHSHSTDLELDPTAQSLLVAEFTTFVQDHMDYDTSDTGFMWLIHLRPLCVAYCGQFTGNSFVRHIPGTDILSSSKARRVDFSALKATGYSYYVDLITSLWLKICPYSYDTCVSLAPINKYKADDPKANAINSSLIDCAEPSNWLEIQKRAYLDIWHVSEGQAAVSDAHSAAGKAYYLDGKLRYCFDCSKVSAMLDTMHQWKSMFFALLFWTSGASLRSTEWRELSLFARQGVNRSVYITSDLERVNGVVCIETSYNKLTNRGGHKRNSVRYLDQRLGQLLVCYLRFVQPWYELLTAALNPDFKPGENCRFFFESHGTIWTNHDFRKALYKFSRINYQESRQMSVWVIENCLNLNSTYDLEEEDDDDLVEDVMANHSTATKLRSYARDHQVLDAQTLKERTSSMTLSRMLQNWFWELSGLLVTSSRTLPLVVPSASTITPFNYVPRPSDALLNSRAALTHFVGKDASFSSDQQAAVCRYISEHPDNNLVYSAPAGRGKSMAFLIPAYLAANSVTIVVVPLESLRNSHLQTAQDYNLSCSDSLRPGHHLYFVTFESFVFNGLGHSFVANMQRTLHGSVRIVLDEVHMYMSEAHYRRFESFSAVCNIPGCSYLLLSGSITNWTNEWIRSNFVGRQLDYFVEDIERVNISYNILADSSVSLLDVMTDENLGRDEQGNLRKGIIFWKGSIQSMYSFVEENELEDVCLVYHAPNNDYSAEDIVPRMELFQNDSRYKYMVTTPALSAGVHFGNVGLTIHAGTVTSLTQHYQEAGRAGRWKHKPLHEYDDISPVCATNIVLAQRPSIPRVDITDPTVPVRAKWAYQDANAWSKVVMAAAEHKCLREAMREAYIRTLPANCAQMNAAPCISCSYNSRTKRPRIGAPYSYHDPASVLDSLRSAMTRYDGTCLYCMTPTRRFTDHCTEECKKVDDNWQEERKVMQQLLQKYQPKFNSHYCDVCFFPKYRSHCNISDKDAMCMSRWNLVDFTVLALNSGDYDPDSLFQEYESNNIIMFRFLWILKGLLL